MLSQFTFRKINFAAAVSILIALAIVSISARAWFGKPAKTDMPQPTAACCVSQAQATAMPAALAVTKIPLSGAVITLTRFGFEPEQVTIQFGRCLLSLRNRSDTEDITLQLTAQAGKRLTSARLQTGRRHWEQVLNLAPGAYVLTEANHPQWIFQLTFTPPD